MRRTHTHSFNGPFSGTTRVGRYQKGKTNLDFTEARDSEWQWHQLGHMQACTSLQTNKPFQHPTTLFLQAGCPSCRPTNSVKALKAAYVNQTPQKRNWSKLSCCRSSHLLSHFTQPVSVMGKTAIPYAITTTSIFCLSIRWLFFSQSILFCKLRTSLFCAALDKYWKG